MLILGLDPGTQKFGYALIQVQGNMIKHERSGIVDLRKISCHWEKMRVLHLHGLDILDADSPDEIAMEAMIYHKNPQTLIKLTQAKIAFCSAFFVSHPGRIYEYPPNVVKKTVSGHGHMAKALLAKKMSTMKISNQPQELESFDQSDALAVALCHNQQRQFKPLNLSTKGRRL